MKGLPVGDCRSCGAGLSYFAPRCPRCGAANLPNPVATVAALLAVALLAGVIAAAIPLVHSISTFRGPSRGQPAVPPDPSARGSDDYGWLVKAMAECEEEAKVKAETMHFLIIPVTTTKTSMLGWSPVPISTVGAHAALLNSTDTMLGLRNGVLTLYPKPVVFAVSDPATQTVVKWRPAVGVAALKSRQTGATSLTLGLEFPDSGQNDVAWGPTINLRPGCYWINALIHSGG
jgi:hypothetical protein